MSVGLAANAARDPGGDARTNVGRVGEPGAERRARSRPAATSSSPTRASSAPSPGCRCRPSRRIAATAAPAIACRTSSAGVPRDARVLRSCRASASRRSTSSSVVDVSEVVRGERRQQAHPDVGGRGAPREAAVRRFLEIVGRQPVVVGTDEHGEVVPCLAGQRRRRCRSRASRSRAGGTTGRLSQCAITGAATRRPGTGARNPGPRARRQRPWRAAERDERARCHLDHERAQGRAAPNGRQRAAATLAAVSHSSRRRWVMTRRTSVRMMACIISHA